MEQNIPHSPNRTCDIVMKGGITSGIVYPKAVFELAKKYKFKNIGGTSAGAIAAALTAAAEYNRLKGNIRGFKELYNIPEVLGRSQGKHSFLFSLFQPNNSTKNIFNLVIGAISKKTKTSKVLHIIKSLIKTFPFISIASSLPSIALGWLIVAFVPNIFICILSFIFCLLFFILTFTFLIGWRAVPIFSSLLKKNKFGLTTGFLKGENNSVKPLTAWLSEKIDNIAEMPKGEPLTFGHLLKINGLDTINLKMVTTNLTWGRPFTFPLEDSNAENLFYYDECELKGYFPDYILTWMKNHSELQSNGLFKLPKSEFLPVIVATRMSLSFPLLISTVPLYAIDRVMGEENDPLYKKCFFSDGGICSNFPVHFFDSPLPKRPTFALNLNQFHPKYPQKSDECKNVYLVNTPSGGLSEHWFNIETVPDFVKSVINTMQNWSDNTQAKVPGYRDRIAHINLNPSEGGLNVNMPAETISKLSTRGECAGQMLAERFTSAHPMNWDNHRWIRFRTTLCLLEENMKNIQRSLDIDTSEIEKSYKDLMSWDINTFPYSRAFTVAQQINAKEFFENLESTIKILRNFEKSFCDNSFRPLPELRIKPKI